MILSQDSIERFLQFMKDNGSSPNTIKAYRADLTALLAACVSVPCHVTVLPALAGADYDTIAAAWLTSLRSNVAPRTLRRKLASCRSFAAWQGEPNALHNYKPPTAAPLEPHPLPGGIQDVLAMIHACSNHRHRALIALTGLCGLRVSEACGVMPMDFKKEYDPFRVNLLVRGKGAKQRIVPVSREAWRHIEPGFAWSLNFRNGEPIVSTGERAAREAITRIGVGAGISRPVASHDLRSTFLTAAYEKSKDIRAVQELAGHASPVTTAGYTGISGDAKRKAAEVT